VYSYRFGVLSGYAGFGSGLSKNIRDCWCAPNVQDCKDPGVDELITLGQPDNVIGIGETGLDYFRSEGDLSWQHQRFRNHINAAKILKKPLIIHTREAKDDTLRILKEEGAGEVGGVIHCFTEDWEFAQKALDLNFYISFSGIVTFNNATVIKEVAKKVPADRFLIETDSPYLAPVPFRGRSNYPIYVRYVAEQIAELRGIPVNKIADISTKNFYDLFNYARLRHSRKIIKRVAISQYFLLIQ